MVSHCLKTATTKQKGQEILRLFWHPFPFFFTLSCLSAVCFPPDSKAPASWFPVQLTKGLLSTKVGATWGPLMEGQQGTKRGCWLLDCFPRASRSGQCMWWGHLLESCSPLVCCFHSLIQEDASYTTLLFRIPSREENRRLSHLRWASEQRRRQQGQHPGAGRSPEDRQGWCGELTQHVAEWAFGVALLGPLGAHTGGDTAVKGCCDPGQGQRSRSPKTGTTGLWSYEMLLFQLSNTSVCSGFTEALVLLHSIISRNNDMN